MWRSSTYHRTDRKGFKAGALEAGLKVARGELIAISMPTSFRPRISSNACCRIFRILVSAVQARWGHIDRDYSLLTKIQAILLDGHFVLEHGGRNRGGRFFNFNGTAGAWRRTAIEEAGGWQHDTLTEDLDLSYRAQLRGWRFVFVSDLIAPAEVPVEMNAFKSQQHRWAKGSIQTCRKLLPRILQSNLPLGIKIEAFFHLTANFNYPLMCVLSMLMFPSMVIRYNMGWYEMLLIDVPLFFAATFSFCNFYIVCQREIHKDWLARLRYVPFLMSVGIGLSINNTRAVLEALFNTPTEFARTPKYRIEGDADEWMGRNTVSLWRSNRSSNWHWACTSRRPFSTRWRIRSTARCRSSCCFRSDFSTRAWCPWFGSTPAIQWSSVHRWRVASKSKVALLRVSPDTILSDIDRLTGLADVSSALAAGKTTILKDNISWHFPFPAANTTPWQLEGTIQALAGQGFTDQVCVQNKTVVTNAFKGEDLNQYVPIFRQYGIPSSTISATRT